MARRRNLFEVEPDVVGFPKVARGLATLGWRAQSLRDEEARTLHRKKDDGRGGKICVRCREDSRFPKSVKSEFSGHMPLFFGALIVLTSAAFSKQVLGRAWFTIRCGPIAARTAHRRRLASRRPAPSQLQSRQSLLLLPCPWQGRLWRLRPRGAVPLLGCTAWRIPGIAPQAARKDPVLPA